MSIDLDELYCSFGFFLAFVIFTCVAVFSTGCDRESSQSPLDPQADSAAQVYQVRGEVVELPSADSAASSLRVRHERIPDFTDRQGQEVGMDVMTMPFPPAAGLDLGDVAVGDKVLLTFEVIWTGPNTGWKATQIEPLPPGTELDLEKVAAEHSHEHGEMAH